VREVARHSDEAVVRGRIDGDGARAERRHERVGSTVALGLGRRERRQKPGGTLEQIGARPAGTARLGSADRMATHEARVVPCRRADGPLRRADIGDGAPAGSRLENVVHDGRQHRDRDGDESDLRLAQRLGERAGGLHGAALRGYLECGRVFVPARDLLDARPPRREARGGADEPGPDDG